MTGTASYDEEIQYLRSYAAEDWLSFLIVLSSAHGVTGGGSPTEEVVEMTVRMSADLIADGALPGDLMDDDRDFVAWEGGPEALLERIRQEMMATVSDGQLPDFLEICWFHRDPRGRGKQRGLD